MKKLKIILILSFVMLALPAHALNDVKKHPIDLWVEKHMSDDYSTAGMRDTINKAREMWEVEMNKVYKRLMSKITQKQQIVLKESQRNWLKFRDTEGKVISEITASRDGTMYQLQATDQGMELVRERTLQLISYEFTDEQ
jgi:uncharacterized protein YecT (DUF1311 family)